MWDRIGNQWRVGADGAIALDYNPLFHVLDRMSLDEKEYDEMFDCIRVIEAEALTVWSEQRAARYENAKRSR